MGCSPRAREDAQVMQIGRGGLGKLAGEVRLAGVNGFVGFELRVTSVATAQVRRAPGDDSVHDIEGKRVRVSAVS